MTDSSEMGEWHEADSISKSETNAASPNQKDNNQNQLNETSTNKSQEDLKDEPPETELQKKKSIPHCKRAKMSGGARLIEILIVILILQRITAGTNLFC